MDAEHSNTIHFLILSDTHDSAFPDPATLPPVDVLLHCGDLTMIGGMSNYKAAIRNLTACKAELKLVIPGNHDVSLDPSWWADNLDEDDDDPDEPTKALALFEAEKEANGIHLLKHGVHEFLFEDGRSFTIFASPYTPAFGGYAFAYGPEHNPWTTIPEAVDIVMTHGPPMAPSTEYSLDLGRNGEHCGCPKLWEHIERTKPRLHCFGHIHEGYGASVANWRNSGGCALEERKNNILKAGQGGQTLLVNAAVMTRGEEENNEPWVVDLDI